MASIMTTLGPMGARRPRHDPAARTRLRRPAHVGPAGLRGGRSGRGRRADGAGDRAGAGARVSPRIVECSTVGVGRRADIDRAVSEATGFPLIVPTGIYREPWVPRWAHEASEDELFEWMLRELDERDRGDRRAGRLDQAECRRRRADRRARRRSCGRPRGPRTRPDASSAAIRSRVASCAISSTSSSDADVPPDRFIWIHTQAEPDVALHLEIARRGAWIEYDAIGSDEFDDAVLRRADRARARRRSRRSAPPEPGSRLVRPGPARRRHAPSIHLHPDRFLPALRAAGRAGRRDLQDLVEVNPFEAFAR